MNAQTIIALALLLSSCAGGAAAIREQANAYTKRVNAVAEALDAAAPMIRVGCGFLNDRPPCASVQQAHRAASAGVNAAHRAIEIYDTTGAGLVAAIDAVVRAESDAANFALEAAKLAEVLRAETHRIESGGPAGVAAAEAGGLDAGTEDAAAAPQAAVSAP